MDRRNFHYPRLLREVVQKSLADTPVVCLLGPRQCGKTTLAQHIAPSRAYLSLDATNYRQLARADPAGFLASLPDAVTVDEIQKAPQLLPEIKLSVDRNRQPGRFLLTGSSNLLLAPQVTESLVGRIEIAQLHPLTEAEKEREPGRFLGTLLDNAFQVGVGTRLVEPLLDGFLLDEALLGGGEDRPRVVGPTLAERVVAGGYPEPLARSAKRARQWQRQYMRIIVERDIRDVARVKNTVELERLFELLALRTATLWNASVLARDLKLHRDTVEQYAAVLERLFLVRRLPAWHRNESKRLVKAPKVHLLDAGLAAAFGRLTEADWLHRRDRMEHLLESFVVQQVIAQIAWTDPDIRVWHYRDKDQVEVDLVVTLGKRTWGIEVKAASTVSPKDGRGLVRLADSCGADFESGILLYSGSDILPLPDRRMLAVPLSALWDR